MSEGSDIPVAEQRKRLPDQPGVYLFKDERGEVIYVGKATSIRKRVGGHFSGKSTRGGAEMIDRIATIDFLVTETEAEALLAEQQFIKRHRPRFNIRLRDDKSYPYIGISLDEEFPRVYFTRERHRSQRLYFGPYSSAKRVRETLDLLGRLFQYRTCEGPEPGRRSGVPCLDYYIKRCAAPCVGYVDREEYRRGIDAIVAFLSGRYRDVERDLERKMAEAAAAEEFERAAVFRDRLEAVRSLMERRSVAGETFDTADLVAVAVEGAEANAQVFQVRDGVLAERHGFYLANEARARRGRGHRGVPRPVLLGRSVGAALGRRRPGARRALRAASPRRSRPGAAVRSRSGSPSGARSGGCASSPSATPCWRSPRTSSDRSAAAPSASTRSRRCRTRSGSRACRCGSRASTSRTSMGEHTVASMVVFEGGAPRKADYRRFRIRGTFRKPRASAQPDTPGREVEEVSASYSDDFASMEEVLSRRVGQLLEQSDRSPHDAERDESFASVPDLVVIDGGKGQLSAGMNVLAPLVERGTAVIGLAKRLEEVYLPGRAQPVEIDRDSEGLRLLQRVRDEAHRFALDHHRNRRDKAMTGSLLDELRGVGPKRKRALLEHFGSPERLVAASREELEAVPGIPGKLARDIHRQLNKAG